MRATILNSFNLFPSNLIWVDRTDAEGTGQNLQILKGVRGTPEYQIVVKGCFLK